MSGYSYHLNRLLGQGGYGKVYEAEKSKGGVSEEVALKVMLDKTQISLTELDVLFRIKNPELIEGWHILNNLDTITYPVDVDDFGDNLAFDEQLVTGSMEGKHLFSLTPEVEQYANTLERKHAILKKFIVQCCQALNCLNNAGYIHMDIKTENILYKVNKPVNSLDDINFYIGDYGIMKNLLGPGKKHLSGTTIYFPPEYGLDIIRGNEFLNITPAVPSWQLGLSIMESLGWQLPIIADIDFPENYAQEIYNRANDIYDDAMTYLETYIASDTELFYVISSLLVRDPRARFKPFDVLAELQIKRDVCDSFIDKPPMTSDKKLLDVIKYLRALKLKNSAVITLEMDTCSTFLAMRYLSLASPEERNRKTSEIALALMNISLSLFGKNANFYNYDLILYICRTLEGKLFDFTALTNEDFIGDFMFKSSYLTNGSESDQLSTLSDMVRAYQHQVK